MTRRLTLPNGSRRGGRCTRATSTSPRSAWCPALAATGLRRNCWATSSATYQGLDVAGHRGGASFAGGAGDAIERFGGVLPGGQHADVVDHDEAAVADRVTVRAVDPSA